MSQTETILLLALGFSLAAVIALFIGRFVWALGLRLGARRMRQQVPSTLVGLQTERDRLRAEYAMLSQRLGSRLELIRMQAAEQLAEVTRHRNRNETLLAESAAKDAKLAAAAEEIAALKDRIVRLETELAAETGELQSLRTELGSREAEIASLHTARPEPAPSPAAAGNGPAEWTPPPGSSEDRLKQRIDELTILSRAISEAKDQATVMSPPAADQAAGQDLAEPNLDASDLQKELERLDAEWSKRLSEIDPEAPSAESKAGAVANVISLANRIRALKKDLAT